MFVVTILLFVSSGTKTVRYVFSLFEQFPPQALNEFRVSICIDMQKKKKTITNGLWHEVFIGNAFKRKIVAHAISGTGQKTITE